MSPKPFPSPNARKSGEEERACDDEVDSVFQGEGEVSPLPNGQEAYRPSSWLSSRFQSRASRMSCREEKRTNNVLNIDMSTWAPLTTGGGPWETKEETSKRKLSLSPTLSRKGDKSLRTSRVAPGGQCPHQEVRM